MTFSFEITHTDPKTLARSGIIHTSRGKIHTPYFVPVATTACMKGLTNEDLEEIGAECFLSNTYHLWLRPGLDVLKAAKGVCGLMNFQKPLFTDSGGFQAFSLGFGMKHNVNKLGGVFPSKKQQEQQAKESQKTFATVTDHGVEFRSIYDGTKLFMNPKISMEIQSILGSDMIMAFDECTSSFSDYAYTKKALERTHKWALECIEYKDPKQALYGIIQGGVYEDLRKEAVEFILAHPFEGIAIGGSLGKSKEDMYMILDWVLPKLDNRPRHLLGIGDIDDIFEGVKRGVDTFDCVSPTRNARRGTVYIFPESGGNRKNRHRINITNAKFKKDFTPIDENCTCSTCKRYTKAYLHHLAKLHELTYFRLASVHNVHFMLELMRRVREAIASDSLLELEKKWMG